MFLASTPSRESKGGLPNGGKDSNRPLCIRCGVAERFWSQCPHPFREELLFGSKTAGESKGKAKWLYARLMLLSRNLNYAIWATTKY